jgi:outer membrane protein, heavy metal efflux system
MVWTLQIRIDRRRIMRSTVFIYFVSILVFPLIAHAGDMPVSLADLEQEALRNNPEILMFVKKAESADQKKSLAAAMPDPMIGYMVQNVGAPLTWSVGQEDMSMQGVVFSQEIPFPGKLSTKGRAAEKEAERMGEAVRGARLKVLNNLRAAYYEYYLAYKSAEILDRTKDLMKNIERIAETRYATGQGMQQDLLRAQVEVAMLLDRISDQQQKKETQAAVINKLVGRDPLASLGRPEDLSVASFDRNQDELAAMALKHSPALAERQRMVEQSKYELSLSKREYLPDMVVSGGWFTRGEKPDVWQASVMFKVPLYFWNKSTGVKAAAADARSSEYEYDAARLETLARVKELYSTIKTSEHHLHFYSAAIIPQTRLAMQSATSNYQVGKTDFLSLLDSQNLLLKYQLMEQEERVNWNRYLSMIGELTGEPHE